MAREAAEAAAGARRQIATCRDQLAELADRLRARPPAFVVTCARGSSDHAATYGKYLLETTVGRVVASVGPSIASNYGRMPVVDGGLFLAITQSGQSPDLLRLTAAARAAGALVVAIVNDISSPLASQAEIVLPLCAGVETSVAATKSFLLTGVAFLQLAAAWTENPELHAAVAAAPDALAAAAALDWMPGLAELASATSLFVIARGIGLGAAYEVALKLKETCRLHAEAFSAAELRHGPIALVGPGFPVIALAQDDPTLPATRDAITQLTALGATVRSTLDGSLPQVPGVPSVLAPLCQVQSFYLAVPQLAAARGHDADAPSHLRKVTETV
jgi:glucosamine--fructose-6-phosphate aminotransferase (isomerizing)